MWSFTTSPIVGFSNGGFEQGNEGWALWSNHNHLGLIGTADFFYSSDITPTVYPHSGTYMGRLGGFGYEENELFQQLIVPSGSPKYLTFYYQLRSSTETECDGYYQGSLTLAIQTQKLVDKYCISQYQNTAGWMKQTFDISAYAGQTVVIVFHVEAPNAFLDLFLFG